MNDELVNSLRSLISLEDPLSINRENRMAAVNHGPYSVADTEEEMREAYNFVSHECATKLQADLLDFLVDIWAWMRAYRESGELWERFGDTDEVQLINIEVNFLRTEGAFRLSRYTIKALIALTKTKMRELALHWIPILSDLPKGTMAVYFTDDDKMREHGFPFDMTFSDSRE